MVHPSASPHYCGPCPPSDPVLAQGASCEAPEHLTMPLVIMWRQPAPRQNSTFPVISSGTLSPIIASMVGTTSCMAGAPSGPEPGWLICLSLM